MGWCLSLAVVVFAAGSGFLVTAADAALRKCTSGTWSGLQLAVAEDSDNMLWDQMSKQIDALIDAGVSGIYTSGTAEEMWTLSDVEFEQLGDLLAQKANAHGIPFQIGCSDPSPQVMLRRVTTAIQRWATKEADPESLLCALQIVLPDWFAVQNDEAAAFLEKIHDTVQSAFYRTRRGDENVGPPGLVLYNPGNAKRILKPVEYLWQNATLSRFLVGVKVVDQGPEWYAGMREVIKDHSMNAKDATACPFTVGLPGHHLATGVMELGRENAMSYSNVAALSPGGAVKWWKMMQPNSTQLQEALQLEVRINDFFAEYVVPFQQAGYSDMALDKLFTVGGGWLPGSSTKLRWPYKSIGHDDALAFGDVARKKLPELFSVTSSYHDLNV